MLYPPILVFQFFSSFGKLVVGSVFQYNVHTSIEWRPQLLGQNLFSAVLNKSDWVKKIYSQLSGSKDLVKVLIEKK